MRQCAAVNSFLIQKDLNGLQTKAYVEKDTQYCTIKLLQPALAIFSHSKQEPWVKKWTFKRRKKWTQRRHPPPTRAVYSTSLKPFVKGKANRIVSLFLRKKRTL